jgi:hypothetical protein
VQPQSQNKKVLKHWTPENGVANMEPEKKKEGSRLE